MQPKRFSLRQLEHVFVEEVFEVNLFDGLARVGGLENDFLGFVPVGVHQLAVAADGDALAVEAIFPQGAEYAGCAVPDTRHGEEGTDVERHGRFAARTGCGFVFFLSEVALPDFFDKRR